MVMCAQQSSVLSFEQARHAVEEHALQLRPRGRELLGLLHAAGRILAEPIHADRDFPPFRRAARDGFAVRAADLQNLPATLEITGEVRAGAAHTPELTPGQAVSIMTGAAAPDGADAIVMVEYTSRTSDCVHITRGIS